MATPVTLSMNEQGDLATSMQITSAHYSQDSGNMTLGEQALDSQLAFASLFCLADANFLLADNWKEKEEDKCEATRDRWGIMLTPCTLAQIASHRGRTLLYFLPWSSIVCFTSQ